MNFSANLINLALLFVLFAFAKFSHISWKSLPAGVALGFGITSSAEIGATSLVSAFGMNGIVSGDIIRMSGFIICTLVWLIYILRPESEQQFMGQSVQKLEMEAWKQKSLKIVG